VERRKEGKEKRIKRENMEMIKDGIRMKGGCKGKFRKKSVK
jgi:hypothetical protein